MANAIKADHLGKRYMLGKERDAYGTVRESLSGFARRAARFATRRGIRQREAFWALDDVSFSVAAGEVLGVVGRNGAGKSTLLKVLARITEPTRGFAEIQGRLGSLLEVGTGFHPELTGRENVFLNGAIMGMSRQDVVRQFDEIVAFAEVDKFIDTPVKRFSSGMYVRLAFAVAAHLQPEVLLVDEVLAVGDYAFQQKCLDKLRNVGGEGRTVLFVSHNMAAVGSLCTRAILLERGRIALDADPASVISEYFGDARREGSSGLIPPDEPRLFGTDAAKFYSASVVGEDGRKVSQLWLGQQPRLHIEVDVLQEIREAVIEVGFVATDGVLSAMSTTIDRARPPRRLRIGRHSLDVTLDVELLPRQYWVLLAIHSYDGTTHDLVERATDFTVVNAGCIPGDCVRWPNVQAYVRAPATWYINNEPLNAS